MSSGRLLLILLAVLLGGAAGLWAQLRWFSPPTAEPAVQGAVPAPALELGDPWPNLRLPDTEGQYRELHEWQGQLVIVNFWATWCPPCREEMPILQTVQDRLADQGLKVLGIALDRPGAVLPFLAEHEIRYPNLFGEIAGGDLPRLFGNSRGALPFTVLVDRNGIIRARHLGSFDEAELLKWIEPWL